MDVRFVFSLIFAVIISIFAIQNAEVVDFDFFMWSFSVSQAIVILLSAVFGAFVVLLLGLIRWIKLGSKIRGSAKTITALQEENLKLKQKLDSVSAKTVPSAENPPAQNLSENVTLSKEENA